jgi:hypothetical protein
VSGIDDDGNAEAVLALYHCVLMPQRRHVRSGCRCATHPRDVRRRECRVPNYPILINGVVSVVMIHDAPCDMRHAPLKRHRAEPTAPIRNSDTSRLAATRTTPSSRCPRQSVFASGSSTRVHMVGVDPPGSKRSGTIAISYANDTAAVYGISIDNHALEVVEVDDTAVWGPTIHEIRISPGQRYSFIVNTDQGKDGAEFWLRAQAVVSGLGVMSVAHHRLRDQSSRRTCGVPLLGRDFLGRAVHAGLVSDAESMRDAESVRAEQDPGPTSRRTRSLALIWT